MKPNAYGFSLIEIMVVVVIIGMLTAAIVPNLMKNKNDAMINRVKMDMASIETALKLYKLQHHKYPDENEGLQTLGKTPTYIVFQGITRLTTLLA